MDAPTSAAPAAPAPRAAAATPVPTIESLINQGLPDGADIPAEALALADDIRDLVEAAVRTDVAPELRARASKLVTEATSILREATREQVVHFVRHADGRVEQLAQAGSGRLNPQAPRLRFVDQPPRPPQGAEPKPVEIRAEVTMSAQHGGPPGRVHGGMVAVLLDQLLGVAAGAAGGAGFTAGLEVRYRRATPYDVPLELTGRWIRREGRKNFVTGEIRADGRVTAEALGVFISELDAGPDSGR